MNFPGSVNDVTQATEMIKFFLEEGEDVAINILMGLRHENQNFSKKQQKS